MTELRSLLHQHSAAPRRDVDVEVLLARARRSRLRNRLAAWVSALAALGAVAFPVEQALVPGGSGGSNVRTVQPPPAPGPAPHPPDRGAISSSTHAAAPSATGPRLSAGTPAPAGRAGAGVGGTGRSASPTDGVAASRPVAGSGVPVAPVPLRPGRYVYTYASHDYTLGGSSSSGRSTLIVNAPTATASGQLQHESYTYNQGGGYVITIRWDYRYDRAGMHQEHYTRDTTLNGVPYDHMDCLDPPKAPSVIP